MADKDTAVIEGLGPRALVPKPVPGVDWKTANLDVRQGYVLSRVDGHTTLGEICAIVALPDTAQILRHLVDVRLITIDGVAPRPQPAAQRPTPARGVSGPAVQRPTPAGGSPRPERAGPTEQDHQAVQARVQKLLDAIPPDRALMAEDVDLDLDRRRQILAMHAAIDQLTYYEMLGLARGASKADVKRAYFRASKVFHPDQYFRKRLGPYAELLQAVFRVLARAYEVLSDDSLRAQYELTLPRV